jgi:hypothetical protein
MIQKELQHIQTPHTAAHEYGLTNADTVRQDILAAMLVETQVFWT